MLKPWMQKYIELRSQIGVEKTDIELCKEIGISRQSLSVFKRSYPKLEEDIQENLIRQYSKLGNKAVNRLYNIISSSKSEKVIKLALELTGLLVPKTQIENVYNTKDKGELLKEANNLLKRYNKD